MRKISIDALAAVRGRRPGSPCNSANSLRLGRWFQCKQVNDFLVSDFAGKFVDVVTGINQFAGFAAHIAQAGLRGDDAVESFAQRFCWIGHE